ncbi:MAG: TerC family protein [Anaerolineales bacterium]|nr:TerC family protein [Anaerolineales bacterium]
MSELIRDPQTWIALLTLTALEIVLGIDNIIFISILAGKLPPEQEERGRKLGLAMAMISRIVLLFSIKWMTELTTPLFPEFCQTTPLFPDFCQKITGRGIILVAGGLFLLGKSTFEIHDKLEAPEGHTRVRVAASFAGVVFQIMLLDIVFSLDSVITAVGIGNHLAVMVVAVVIAVIVMMYASGPISEFVNRHPTLKILALSFLLLIGVSLIAEGLDFHIPKGYIYFAMAFSFFVEMLNLRLHDKELDPIRLRQPLAPEDDEPLPDEG